MVTNTASEVVTQRYLVLASIEAECHVYVVIASEIEDVPAKEMLPHCPDNNIVLTQRLSVSIAFDTSSDAFVFSVLSYYEPFLVVTI